MRRTAGPLAFGLLVSLALLPAGCAAPSGSASPPPVAPDTSSHRRMAFVLADGGSCDLTAQPPAEWKATNLEGGVVYYDLVGGPGRLVITTDALPGRRVVHDLVDLRPGTRITFADRAVQVVEP